MPAGLDRAPGAKGYKGTWGRKEEEYMADFELVARRRLDPWHYRLFRYHFLLGAGSGLISRKLGMTRGKFFHAIYWVEEQLGLAYHDLQPYALYPPRAYFGYRSPEPVKPCDPRTVLTPPIAAQRAALRRLAQLPISA